ncbi:MAG: J domain-containing protein [Hespellia sp.]|nr:J domain-containing protein [Hespellia sp.]
MAKKDYYDTLGVNKSADEKAIKQAYRKLAKRYHPDTNQGNKNAEQKFKEVTEAYNVLSDKEKKKMYDQYGTAAFEEGFENGGFRGNTQEYHFEGGNMDDIFGDLFGNGFFGRKTATRKGADIQSDITIGFEEAAFGCDKVFQLQEDRRVSSIQVHIPAGIDEGKSVRLKGKGQPGFGGAEAGDLLLKVHIREKPGYERRGMDVYTTANIPFTTAVLGGEAKVSTLYGDVLCRIPEGAQSGSKIRLRGKGIVSMKNPSVHGNQYITIQIQVPKNLTIEAKEKLREFANMVKL